MYPEFNTTEEAVSLVKSGDRVFIHGSAATPLPLVNALLDCAGELHDVELVSISTYGDINWNRPDALESFYMNSLFVSANIRGWVNAASGD